MGSADVCNLPKRATIVETAASLRDLGLLAKR
jgi:hypothetical protein